MAANPITIIVRSFLYKPSPTNDTATILLNTNSIPVGKLNFWLNQNLSRVLTKNGLRLAHIITRKKVSRLELIAEKDQENFLLCRITRLYSISDTKKPWRENPRKTHPISK